MHYYNFNIGDYASHTRHLTLMEDIAYRRLLDLYYLHERPLNVDATLVAKQIGMRDEVATVRDVLNEFFERTEEGYLNTRADREIAHFHAKIEQASRAGKASAERRLNGRSTGLATDVQPNNNQETINNKPPIVPQGGRFDEFWSAWPASGRKVGKASCQTKWAKRKLDDIADKILSHVRVMKQTEQWRTGFEPAPLTYLNQSRWEDDLPAANSAGMPDWMRGAV